MDKRLKMLTLLMAVATLVYVLAEVYAHVNSNDEIGGIAYSAPLYRGETPPSVWYTPEELGAVEVVDFGYEDATIVWLVVPEGAEPFNLMEVKPIFKFKERFYQVSEFWHGYPVPKNLPQYPVGVGLIGTGWCITGFIYWKKREKTYEGSLSPQLSCFS